MAICGEELSESLSAKPADADHLQDVARSNRAISWALGKLVPKLIGLILVYSAIAKIRQPYLFLSDVYAHHLVNQKLGLLVVVVFPWIELIVGICLVTGIAMLGATAGAVCLSSVFVFVTARAMKLHLSIDCGCFGTAGRGAIDIWTVARSSLLWLASVGSLLNLLFE